MLLIAAAGLIFLALGLKAYWEHSGSLALFVLGETLALGLIAARVAKRFFKPSS